MKLKSKPWFVLIGLMCLGGGAFGQSQNLPPPTIEEIQRQWDKNATLFLHYYVETEVTEYRDKHYEERERVRDLQRAGAAADIPYSSISMAQERPYIQIEVRDGVKKAEASVDAVTGAIRGPLWYFDGKRTHLLTGATVQNGVVVQQAKKVKDTVTNSEAVGGSPPFDAFSAALGTPLDALRKDAEFQELDSSKPNAVVLKGKMKSSGRTFVATLNGKPDYLPVKAVQRNGQFHYVNQVTKMQDVRNRVMIKSYKTEGFDGDTLVFSKTLNIRRVSLEPQVDFFRQLDALIIGRVYNQDEKAAYRLDAPLKNFDGEQGISFRRVMGWLFVVCLTGLVGAFAFWVASRRRERSSPA